MNATFQDINPIVFAGKTSKELKIQSSLQHLKVHQSVLLSDIFFTIYKPDGSKVVDIIQPNYFRPQVKIAGISIFENMFTEEDVLGEGAYGIDPTIPMRDLNIHFDRITGLEATAEYKHEGASCLVLLTLLFKKLS
jgi:hypothetical protein